MRVLRLGAVLHLAGRVAVRCSCLRWRCDETRWSALPMCIYVDSGDWSCFATHLASMNIAQQRCSIAYSSFVRRLLQIFFQHWHVKNCVRLCDAARVARS